MMRCAIALSLLVLAVAGFALQADAQVLPLERTGSLILLDQGDDLVYRLTDFNLDGDYNDLGEIIEFYDAADPGGASSSPFTLTTGPRGYVYLSNSSLNHIVRLKDINGDGDAEDAGESLIYIDSSNASGAGLSALFGMAFDTNGDLYVSNSGSGSSIDWVGRCRDLDGDGDCNDAGEITVFYDSPTASGLGLPVLKTPLFCLLLSDGWLLVTDVNAPAGNDVILRMKDLNGDGDVYDAGELGVFYDDTVGSVAFDMVDTLALTHDGKLILNDSGQDKLFIAEDLNGGRRHRGCGRGGPLSQRQRHVAPRLLEGYRRLWPKLPLTGMWPSSRPRIPMASWD